MSKKAGKNHNHNRPRRTILPARGTTIQIGWAQYNESRRSKGRRYAERMRRVADTVRGILGIPQDRRDRRVSAILIAIVKSENLSCGGPVRRFDKRPEDLERRGLYGPYSRAQYQLRVSIMPKVQQEILARMAGEEAVHGANTVDSDGYGVAPHKEWQNAEYGRLGVQDFTELRVIHAPHGKTCAATATLGNANGSPYPRKMIRIIPDGSGGVAGGAAYGGIKNRNAIRDGGRMAAMDPKSDATPKGFNGGCPRSPTGGSSNY